MKKYQTRVFITQTEEFLSKIEGSEIYHRKVIKLWTELLEDLVIVR